MKICKKIQSICAIQALKAAIFFVIIAQTAYALTGDREKAMENGCNDYISKPIKREKLMELVEKYFNK